jgi:hypothetical protein
MDNAASGIRQKALALHLDATMYGTLAARAGNVNGLSESACGVGGTLKPAWYYHLTLSCRGILQSRHRPESHSEKRYAFSAHEISVRDRRIDEFWNAGWRLFVTTAGRAESSAAACD